MTVALFFDHRMNAFSHLMASVLENFLPLSQKVWLSSKRATDQKVELRPQAPGVSF